MNPSLLAIGVVATGAPGVSVCPVSSESVAKNVKHSLTTSSDSPFLSDSNQPTQFDKVLAVAELHSSDDALSGEGPLAVSQENRDEPELVTEDCNFLAVPATDLGQLAVLIASPVANVTVAEGEVIEINPDKPESALQGGPQPQNNPAPLISVLPDYELPLVTLPAPELNVTPALASQEAAGGPIPLAVQSGDEPFPISSNQSVTGDVTADIPPRQLVTDTEQMVDESGTGFQPVKTRPEWPCYTIGENPPEAEGSDAALVSKYPSIQQSGKDVSAGFDADKSGSAALMGKMPVPDEPADSNGQKMIQLDPLVPPVGGYAQTVSANPEESGFAARKPIDNKTAAGQKTRILSESADSGGKKSINNLLSDTASQKLDVAEIQVSAHQAEDPTVSVSEINPNLQQILSDNNAQILSQRSSASQSSDTANTAYPGDLSFSIGRQILESIHGSLNGGDRQISIRLNPPELGKVFIRFQEHDAQITGLLEVSQTQTRYQIEQMLPQIIRDLQDSGIQIKQLEVVLTEQSGYNASQDQSLLNGWSEQHSSAESGTPGSNKSADTGLINSDGYQDSLSRQVQVTDDSINILV